MSDLEPITIRDEVHDFAAFEDGSAVKALNDLIRAGRRTGIAAFLAAEMRDRLITQQADPAAIGLLADELREQLTQTNLATRPDILPELP